jgi:hypothetical protein
MTRWTGWVATICALIGMRGGVLAQCQSAKLAPADLDCRDYFGSSVAIDGDWAIVGSPQDDDLFEQSGAVYVFHRVNGTWAQTQKLKAGDAEYGDGFGYALAMDQGRAVIGAYFEAPQGVQGAGSAYVFELIGDTWVQRAKIWANNPTASTFFGETVALSGGRIVVGSYAASPVSLYSGAAWVFEGAGSVWTQVAMLVPSDAAPGDGFGSAVALDGTRLVVTASNADLPQGHDVGVAYVFESPAPGVWVERQKLVPSDGATSDAFGISVDVEGDTILIGSVLHDGAYPNSGAVYVFQWGGASWIETQQLVPFDADAEDRFGAAATMNGDLAVISCHVDDDLGWNSGAGYAFRREGSTWVQIGKLLAVDGSALDLFGAPVGLSGTTAIVGCFGDDDASPQDPGCQSGSAYIFELAPTAAQYGSCATSAPCGNPDVHGGCANSTGQGAILQACGSGSIAIDELVLEARALPPNTSGILFMGAGQTDSTFGDGQRVVATGGVGFFRFGVQQADAQGVIVRGPGLVAQSQGFVPAGQIAAGQTWNFQCWYRNPAGPCGSFFNLSNGVVVWFTP